MLTTGLRVISSLLILHLSRTVGSPHVVLLSQSPIVRNSEPTTLTCADLTKTLPRASLSIRRQFKWSESRTTEPSSTKQVMNESAVMEEWTDNNTDKAIGAFGCGTGDDSVSAVKIHANGSLVPQTFSKLAVVGEKVVIKMNLSVGASTELRKVTWYKDGHILDTRGTLRIWEAEGGRALAINSTTLDDAGIYMAHHEDEEKTYAVGTVLIVRHCTRNRWSTACDRICPTCTNGGACDEKTGQCFCQPGFHGQRCEEVCAESRFGFNCEYSCNVISLNGSSCQGIQQCSTIGCSCMNGWTGPDCGKECPEGFHGSDCKYECNCKNGGTCSRFEGCICSPEWRGKSCELPTAGESPPPPDPDLQERDKVPPPSPVERKPNITKIEADPSFKVNQGQRVEIKCSVTGVPAPGHGETKLERKDGTEIFPTVTKRDTEVTTTHFSLEMGSYSGPFWCVAKTRAGQARKEFNFTIPVLPTPRYPPELISKGPKRLKLKLNSQPFEGDGPIVKTLLLLRHTDNEPSFSTFERKIYNDTAVINDLEPYTNYTFRVLLYREGGYTGRGHPGPIAIIRTDCDHPTLGPTVKNIYSQNNSILHLSWRPPPASAIKGKIEGYKIYYRELGVSSSWTIVNIVSSSSTSETLKNMKPFAVYSVKLRLYNCAGDSPDSKEVRVTMGRLEKPAGPEVKLSNQTSRSLDFKWLPPKNAKPYTISGYEISLEEVDNLPPNGLQILQNVSDLEFNATSLSPHTKYRFQVRAYNHEGPGNFSDELIVITDEEAPGIPAHFRVSGKAPSEVQLVWDEPAQSNGIIREYVVNHTNAEGDWIAVTLSGQTRQTSIEKLEEYTEFKFRIRAITIEPGIWSDVIEARTMSRKPLEAPQSIVVTSPSPQSVQITWDPPPPSEYVHDIRKYKIAFTDDTRQKTEHWNAKHVPGADRAVTIDGLRPSTMYHFVVAAVTEEIGPYSEKKSERTLQLGPPPPPTRLLVTNVTADSAIIRWEIPNGYSITAVRVRVKSVGTVEWEDKYFPAWQGRGELKILSSSTTYNMEATAVNHKGESPAYAINFETRDERILGESEIYRILIPVLAVVVVIFVVIAIAYCKCRRRSDADSMSPLEMDAFSRGSAIGPGYRVGTAHSGTLLSTHSFRSATSRAPSIHSGQLLLPDHLILSWDNIFFEDITLGEGNFGQVVKAVIQIDEKCIQAAVKMLKDGCSADDRKDFLAELDMMVRIGKHQNIISLIGACEHDSCLYLCTEFAPNGNLLQFLRKSRLAGVDGTYTTLTQDQLLQFALDVCQGMAFLSDKELIHRDLAARNVLLSGNLTCKVADFGLSRGEGVYVKKTVARLPIRWMAIESLNYNVYTTKSDVWSFGVLLWEIVSLGGTPYYGMSCAELYEKLPTGFRMEQPLNCDNEVYKLMCQCWKDRMHDRPSFSQLCVALKRMIEARSNRSYVNTSIFENFKFSMIDVQEEEED